MIFSRNMLKIWVRVDTLVGLQLLFILVFYAAVEEDCTGGLVIEVFDDSVRLMLMYFSMGSGQILFVTRLQFH